jgi:two-component system cell cycle response regulator
LTQTLIRGEDLIARYGGEEFALVLNHTDARGGVILGKRILKSIEEARFEPEVEELKVTISMGVATYPNDDVESVEELVRRADERLYRAKMGGRNQVIGLE